MGVVDVCSPIIEEVALPHPSSRILPARRINPNDSSMRLSLRHDAEVSDGWGEDDGGGADMDVGATSGKGRRKRVSLGAVRVS